MRGDDRRDRRIDAGSLRFEKARQQLFMIGIGVGINEAYGDCGAALLLEARDGGTGTLEIEREPRRAGRHHPLLHLEAAAARHERLRFLGEQIPDVAALLALEFQHVAKALGGDQPDIGTLALQDGVGGDRGSMDDCRDGGEIAIELADRLHRAQRLVGRGDGLGHPDLAIGGDHDRIGEGAADIDPDEGADGHAVALPGAAAGWPMAAAACG